MWKRWANVLWIVLQVLASLLFIIGFYRLWEYRVGILGW